MFNESLLGPYLKNADLVGLEEILSEFPSQANVGIALDPDNKTFAHPLHRLCDGVFHQLYSEDEAVAMAKILLKYGADVQGGALKACQDSPLIAAASLRSDQLAILYLTRGANVEHRGTFGGTALHWASWCGRDKIVEILVEKVSNINLRCTDHQATPIFWAVHGSINASTDGQLNQLRCAQMLLSHGADPSIPNGEGILISDLLANKSGLWKDLLV